MTPSVGRIVHYTSPGSADGVHPSACRAAIVTEVTGDTVSLAVLNPTGVHFRQDVPAAETPQVGAWHCPERV